MAGALSDNVVHATTDAFVRDAEITLSGVPLENFVVETAALRFSVTADSAGDIWTLAAGGAGALADGGSAIVLAGSVSLNTITGHTRAHVIDTELTMLETEADRASSDKVLLLTYGTTVRIASGPNAGDVYVYVGPETSVDYDYTIDDAPKQLTNGQRVLRPGGEGSIGPNDVVFKYIGTNPLVNTEDPTEGVDLAGQNYADTLLWSVETTTSLLPANAAAFAASSLSRLTRSG